MLLKRVGPPVLAFVLARIALWWFALGVGHDANTASAWAHWDSAHYLAIAERGYEFMSCALVPGYDPKLFCGNTAWMPGYPLLIRLVALAGIPYVAAGALLSAAFALALLIVLWNAFLGPALSATGLLCLALAAFFPGHVYDHAVFPIALFAFLQVVALRFYADRRFALAGLFGGLAAFTYSSGLFLCGVLGLHMLIADRDRPYAEQLRNLLLSPGLVAVGFIAALIVQWAEVGVWNSYFLVQAKYAYEFTQPLRPLARHFATALEAFPRGGGQSEQSAFVAILCVLLLAHAWWARPRQRIDGVLSLFVLVYWLVPLMMGGSLSIYRAEATLLPAVPLARNVRWPALCGLVLVAVLLSRLMSKLFFKGVLV